MCLGPISDRRVRAVTRNLGRDSQLLSAGRKGAPSRVLIGAIDFSIKSFFGSPFLHILRTALGRFAARSVSPHKQTSQPATLLANPRQAPPAASRPREIARAGGDFRRVAVAAVSHRKQSTSLPPPLNHDVAPRRRRHTRPVGAVGETSSRTLAAAVAADYRRAAIFADRITNKKTSLLRSTPPPLLPRRSLSDADGHVHRRRTHGPRRGSHDRPDAKSLPPTLEKSRRRRRRGKREGGGRGREGGEGERSPSRRGGGASGSAESPGTSVGLRKPTRRRRGSNPNSDTG